MLKLKIVCVIDNSSLLQIDAISVQKFEFLQQTHITKKSIKFHRFSSNSIKFHQVLSISIEFRKILSNFITDYPLD